MKELNTFLPNLKFTLESLKKRVVFLDLKFSLENGSTSTDNTKNSMICSQNLRLAIFVCIKRTLINIS